MEIISATGFEVSDPCQNYEQDSKTLGWFYDPGSAYEFAKQYIASHKNEMNTSDGYTGHLMITQWIGSETVGKPHYMEHGETPDPEPYWSREMLPLDPDIEAAIEAGKN